MSKWILERTDYRNDDESVFNSDTIRYLIYGKYETKEEGLYFIQRRGELFDTKSDTPTVIIRYPYLIIMYRLKEIMEDK